MARPVSGENLTPRVLAVSGSDETLGALRLALEGNAGTADAGVLETASCFEEARERLQDKGESFSTIVVDADAVDLDALGPLGAGVGPPEVIVAASPEDAATGGTPEDALTKPLCVEQARERLGAAAARWRARQDGSEASVDDGFFRRLVERSADAFLQVSADGLIQYASPAIEPLTGFAPAELQDRLAIRLLHPEARRRGALAFAKQLRDRTPCLYYEFPVATKSGALVWGGVTVQLLLENGEPAGFQACARDVTRRRDALEAMRRDEEAWHTIVESIGDGIRVLDSEFRIRRVNATMRRWFASGEPLEGKRCHEAFRGSETLCAECPAVDALATGEPRSRVAPLTPDGEDRRWFELHAYPMRDAEGAVYGVVEHLRDVTDRKAAEEALQESESRFRNVYLNSPVMMFALSEAAVFVSVNRAFYHKLGYKRTAVLGRQLREFLANPSDYEALTALWPKLWSEGRGRNVRLNFAGREGAVLNCSAHASIASSDTGERTALFVLTDETERRRAEEAAQTSRTFLDAVSDAIIIMERDTGRIVKVNDRFRHIFGYDASEAGGLTLCALAGEDPPGLLNRMEAASAAGELLEWQARAKDGRLFWVEANARLIDEDDSARIVAALRDVSSRKQTELELTHLRAAVEDTTAAVLIADVSGQPTYFNMAFGNLFGYTRQQAAEVRFPGLCVDEPRGAHLLEAIHAGRSWEGELAMRSRDGREFPAYLRGAPILDDAFEVAGLAFVLNDMTERKQIEAQLLQSQNIKSIGQLAAGIAHEINTPMQYVGDNTRFLQESFADLSKVLTTYEDALEAGASPEKITAAARAAEDADVAYLIEEIPAAIAQTLEGVDRVTTIVRAMRQFTHPGTDDKTMVNLNDLVQSTATVAQNEYKYVAEADLRLDDELPDAPCLRGDLNQVILNLIVNAAHAIGEAIDESKGERGVITITTRHDADCVELRIADTGTGIPPDIQDRIFDPFFTTKDVGKGTGQGLAICHAVVAEKHGGTLTFETTPGQGTEFIIRLPRRNPAVPGPGQDAMESTDGHD